MTHVDLQHVMWIFHFLWVCDSRRSMCGQDFVDPIRVLDILDKILNILNILNLWLQFHTGVRGSSNEEAC